MSDRRSRLPERLVLVRHAMPAAVPDIPARDWQLSADGRLAARALRDRLPPAALLVASDEPKARQTLQEASGGAPVLTDPGFGEVHRPDEWVSDHRERARAYVQGVRHEGWESQPDVVARFEAALLRFAVSHWCPEPLWTPTGNSHPTAGRVLVVGTHGMAATVWPAAHTGIDPGPFWAALRFPDLLDVDLTAGTVTSSGTVTGPGPGSGTVTVTGSGSGSG